MTTRSAAALRAAALLSAAALVVSGASATALIVRPAWVIPQIFEIVVVTSVAVVPTLLFGAVLLLLRPSLRGRRAVHLGVLVLGALGFVMLAAAGWSWITALEAADTAYTVGAGDAGDVSQQSSLAARLFPYCAIGSVLLIWSSLTTFGLMVGPPVVRSVRRVVAVASTTLALTLTTMACIPNPIAQALIAAAVLVIVVILAHAKRLANGTTLHQQRLQNP
jgi:hypothetical protein